MGFSESHETSNWDHSQEAEMNSPPHLADLNNSLCNLT